MMGRLAELKSQAEFVADRYASQDEFAQQFADLILKDVLAIVSPKHDSRTETFRAHRDLFNNIKDHFELSQTPCRHIWTVSNLSLIHI